MGQDNKMKEKSKNKTFFSEVWSFIKEKKVWWLIPIVLVLIIAGILVVFSQSSAISPFLYALL